jgi:hypothetical protein
MLAQEIARYHRSDSANFFSAKLLQPLEPLLPLFLHQPSFVFKSLQPLFQKHPGRGYPNKVAQPLMAVLDDLVRDTKLRPQTDGCFKQGL